MKVVGDRFTTTGVTEGWPDLTGCLPWSGRFLGVECKTRTGKKRALQIETIDRLNAAGALAFFARSAHEVYERLKSDKAEWESKNKV